MHVVLVTEFSVQISTLVSHVNHRAVTKLSLYSNTGYLLTLNVYETQCLAADLTSSRLLLTLIKGLSRMYNR